MKTLYFKNLSLIVLMLTTSLTAFAQSPANKVSGLTVSINVLDVVNGWRSNLQYRIKNDSWKTGWLTLNLDTGFSSETKIPADELGLIRDIEKRGFGKDRCAPMLNCRIFISKAQFAGLSSYLDKVRDDSANVIHAAEELQRQQETAHINQIIKENEARELAYKQKQEAIAKQREADLGPIIAKNKNKRSQFSAIEGDWYESGTNSRWSYNYVRRVVVDEKNKSLDVYNCNINLYWATDGTECVPRSSNDVDAIHYLYNPIFNGFCEVKLGSVNSDATSNFTLKDNCETNYLVSNDDPRHLLSLSNPLDLTSQAGTESSRTKETFERIDSQFAKRPKTPLDSPALSPKIQGALNQIVGDWYPTNISKDSSSSSDEIRHSYVLRITKHGISGVDILYCDRGSWENSAPHRCTDYRPDYLFYFSTVNGFCTLDARGDYCESGYRLTPTGEIDVFGSPLSTTGSHFEGEYTKVNKQDVPAPSVTTTSQPVPVTDTNAKVGQLPPKRRKR